MDEETKYTIQMICADEEWSNFYKGEGSDFKGNFIEVELPQFRIVKVTTSVVENITLVIQSESTEK